MVHGVINERRSYQSKLHDDVITWNHFILLALCEGNPHNKRPVVGRLDMFFDVGLNYIIIDRIICFLNVSFYIVSL